MSYGSQAGYGNQNLQLGMPVHSDNGWSGTITEVIPAAPGYEGAVRVAWNGDGTTLVGLSVFTVENGQAIIRTQPAPQQPIEQAAPIVNQPIVSEPMTADDDQTRLVAPVRNDPSHVNPYVTDAPLVTREESPIHPTHGGQVHDGDATYIPPVPRQQAADVADADLDMTYIPPVPRQESASVAPPDLDATFVPPVPRSTTALPEVSTHGEYGAEPETLIPRAPAPSAPDMPTGVMTGIPARPPAAHETDVMDAGEQEVTVPIIEEQVEAHPEWRDAGSVTVRTVMEEVPHTITRETQREELFVERVAVGRELAVGEEVAPREEGDTYIIPVVVEEAVVVMRRMLTEELRITKRVIPTTQTVQAVTRKERIEIDAGTLADRVHDGTDTDAATDMPQAPRTEYPS